MPTWSIIRASYAATLMYHELKSELELDLLQLHAVNSNDAKDFSAYFVHLAGLAYRGIIEDADRDVLGEARDFKFFFDSWKSMTSNDHIATNEKWSPMALLFRDSALASTMQRTSKSFQTGDRRYPTKYEGDFLIDYQLTSILDTVVHPYYERKIKQKASADKFFLPTTTQSFITFLHNGRLPSGNDVRDSNEVHAAQWRGEFFKSLTLGETKTSISMLSDERISAASLQSRDHLGQGIWHKFAFLQSKEDLASFQTSILPAVKRLYATAGDTRVVGSEDTVPEALNIFADKNGLFPVHIAIQVALFQSAKVRERALGGVQGTHTVGFEALTSIVHQSMLHDVRKTRHVPFCPLRPFFFEDVVKFMMSAEALDKSIDGSSGGVLGVGLDGIITDLLKTKLEILFTAECAIWKQHNPRCLSHVLPCNAWGFACALPVVYGPVSKLNNYGVHFFYNPNLPYTSALVSHTVFNERT